MASNDGTRRPLITLTTDFGLADPYVAAMKGVILGLNPHVNLVDVTHEIRPQQLRQAAYFTQAAWPAFSPDAIHVAVVDPGVGGERRAIALVTPRGCYVGPDNGVLSSALPDEARAHDADGPAPVALPAGHRAYAITEPRYLRQPVSATFHGRDVFAPAAAHLSLGVQAEELGEPVEALLAFPPLRARRGADGALEGQVLHIDRFGNVITDVRADDLPVGAFAVELAGQAVPGPVLTYAELAGLGAIAGSSGYLEVALPNRSAAEALDVDIGAPIRLRPEH